MIEAIEGRCEERNFHNPELPCNAPATKVVQPRDGGEGPYRMCEPHAQHSLQNRGFTLVEELPAEASSEEPAVPETGTDIIAVVEHRPEIVLLDEKKRDELLDHIRAEIARFEPDLTTAKGREEIKSFAAKITRTKTAADRARLAMTADARDKIKLLNEAGKGVIEPLAALAKEARAPLTEWEEVEEKRLADCTAALDRFRQAAVVPLGITSDSIRTRIVEVRAESMAVERWQGMLELAEKARTTAIDALNAALERVEKEEADRAELERLRAEAAAVEQERLAREAREREEAEARERQEREAAEAAEAEQRRQAEIEESRQREAERAAREEEQRKTTADAAAKEAEERARREEQQRAEEAADEQRRQHEAELTTERQRAADERAERERLEAAERERQQQEKAAREARERAEADAARRKLVKTEAKEALMTTGMSEDHAQKAVLLIIAGEVPRVSLDFAAEPKVRRADPEPAVDAKPEGALI